MENITTIQGIGIIHGFGKDAFKHLAEKERLYHWDFLYPSQMCIKEKYAGKLLQYTGCFFTGPPPKKLKYGKLRLGKVRCI